jgi:hypothetical protein
MFIFILILILLSPVALLSLALGSFFESEELIDMGVYLENAQPMAASNKKRAAGSKSGSSSLVTSPFT